MYELNIKVIGVNKGALLEAVQAALATNFEQTVIRSTPTFGVSITVSETEDKGINDIFNH